MSPPTATVQYLNYDGTLAALSPTEIASFSATACDQRAVSATIKLGSGNAANLAWGQDGTTFNFQTFLTSPGITTLLGGVAVLQGYEVVVEQGSNPAGPASANRTEFTEPGSGSGTNAMRVLSQGESVRADASDADVAGLIVDPTTGVTIFGVSRALIKVTAKRGVALAPLPD